MYAPRQQRTIAKPVAVEGFGLWSGRDVRIEFHPAEPDTGIVFVRSDVDKAARIAASVANRIETPRRTTLSAAGSHVEMVEHVMAALAGLQVDNCLIHANNAEMPGCDGSSLPFVKVLDEAGTVAQSAVRAHLIVRSITRLGDDESWIEARPCTSGRLSIKYHLDYGSGNAIGRQTLQLNISPETFRSELAPSRTFVLLEEAQWLVSRGLGRRATYRDVLVFDNDGPVDNELRFQDECVRHKTLDLLGDLALAGCDMVGHIVAHRSGHRLNAEMVRALLTEEEVVGGWRRSA